MQRRASAKGAITVCRQRIGLGEANAGKTITVHVSADTFAVELGDETLTVRRTTDRPVWNVKANRPIHRRQAQ